MEKKRIIIELYHNNSLESTSLALSQGEEAKFDISAAGIEKSPGISIDKDYGVVQLPKLSRVDPFDMNVSDDEKKNYYVGDMSVDLAPTSSTYLVRAEVDAKKLEKVCTELEANSQVAAVFSDVAIEPCIICPGSPAVGSHTDVERLLCVSKMKAKGMTGRGVFVAIVDTGVNMNYLNSKGKTPSINLAWSWKPTTSAITLGSAPVGHGTMCAFDVCIAAPQSTLLDIALLSSGAGGGFSGFLSDAIKAYEHLIRFMNRNIRPGENKSLVVNNSWGMFHPSWDFPVGDPRNYSSNPLHPFNRIVGTLAAMGADILFAAGNCGSECPDGRCQNVTNQGIYGANSHPAVTTVVGIGVNSERVGYSNRGPGRLANRKPDITAFTHFAGSGVYTADGGTSAATPVLAGVVSAIRTQRPYVSGSPSATPTAIKTLLTSTATDIGVTGYDFTYGFGLVNGCAIVNKLFPIVVSPGRNFCDLYPFICDLLRKDRVVILDFCKTHPRACVEIERFKDRLPIDIDPEKIRGISDISQDISEEEHLKKLEHEVSLYLQNISVTSEIETDTHRCNCGGK